MSDSRGLVSTKQAPKRLKFLRPSGGGPTVSPPTALALRLPSSRVLFLGVITLTLFGLTATVLSVPALNHCFCIQYFPLQLSCCVSPFISTGFVRTKLTLKARLIPPRRFRRHLLIFLLGDLDGTGAYVPVTDTFFFFVCGCASSPPSPTPSPILAPTSAPSPESGGGSGNEMVIGGSVGGVVALLAIIVGVFVWHRRQARGDSNFGGSPPAPASFPVASGGVGRSGGNGAAPPLPPPPAYSEPPPPKVDVGAPPAGDLLPPPPAYSEPPPYSG